MAKDLPLSRTGAILELGGGTGVVTQGLIEAGCPEERLIVVEREAALAEILQRRFGRCRVIEGDACAIDEILRRLDVTRLAVVISSLPIKWFSIASQQAVMWPCFERLGEGGAFLQLTNTLVSPVTMTKLGIDGREIARIWMQFPPVQIWRYVRAETPADRPAFDHGGAE